MASLEIHLTDRPEAYEEALDSALEMMRDDGWSSSKDIALIEELYKAIRQASVS